MRRSSLKTKHGKSRPLPYLYMYGTLEYMTCTHRAKMHTAAPQPLNLARAPGRAILASYLVMPPDKGTVVHVCAQGANFPI